MPLGKMIGIALFMFFAVWAANDVRRLANGHYPTFNGWMMLVEVMGVIAGLWLIARGSTKRT